MAINVSDFSYIKEGELGRKSNVFGLIDENGKNKFSKKLVLKAMGSGVKTVNVLGEGQRKQGILIEYNEGDACGLSGSQRFKVSLLISCYKEEVFVKPTVIKDDQCSLLIEWRSIHGCRACTEKDVTRNESACKDGSKSVLFKESKECIILGSDNQEVKENDINLLLWEENRGTNILLVDFLSEYEKKKGGKIVSDVKSQEECSIQENIDETIIVSLATAGVLILVLAFCAVCYKIKYRKTKWDYMAMRTLPSFKISDAQQTEETNQI